MWSEEDIREALKDVYDPELGVNIIDLGLVYGIDIAGDGVTVRMTLTSPACPLGPEIIETVKSVLGALPMVGRVDVQLVWTPRWDPQTMASDEAKMELGIYYPQICPTRHNRRAVVPSRRCIRAAERPLALGVKGG